MNVKALALYIGGVALLLGVIVFFGSRGAVSSQFTSSSPDRPIAEVEKVSEDFGAISNKDVKSALFTIKNTGKSELQLSQVSTSCDCTYVYITVGGQKSPKFTMHGRNSWIGKVAPNAVAQVEVIYEPAIMPVNGVVQRTVTVVTNDPNKPSVTFKINADVKD